MKVYNIPSDVPFGPDYTDYDFDRERAREQAHQEKLTAWAKSIGYTGPNTGKVFSIAHADGYAQYLVLQTLRGAISLVHLPYGDAWNSPWAARATKKDVLDGIRRDESLKSLFAARKAEVEAKANG